MIHYLINIADSVKQFLPQLEKAVYPARIDEEGRILMQSTANQNEFVYAGIRDSDSNYFYIRHRDSGEIFFEESPAKAKISCGQSSTVARYEFRLVAVLKNWCPYNTEENLRMALLHADLPNYTQSSPIRVNISNVGVKMVKSCIDSIQVLKDETSKPKQFDKNNIFVAVDFDLYMDYTYF
jgi:hypothetical protein